MPEIFLGNIKGEKGEPGAGFKVLDFFSSLDALAATVTNPSAGDAYGVGSAAPYDIYIYAPSSGWVNNGAIQGAKGEQGEKGADGAPGQDGADGTSATITGVTATVDETTGTPGVTVTMGGTASERSFAFAFSGLKGAKGDKGDTGADGADGTDGVTTTYDGGFSAGDGARATSGGAVGKDTCAGQGGAVGEGAFATSGGAVGINTYAGGGFAGGNGARAAGEYNQPLDSIQLGRGTNQTERTLQVYDYRLMNADGTIPVDRLPAGVELWENTDTTADFAAQTISLDLSEYKRVRIVFVTHKDSQDSRAEIECREKGCSYFASNGVKSYREVKFNEDGIVFKAGAIDYAGNNSTMIPKKIIGYKY